MESEAKLRDETGILRNKCNQLKEIIHELESAGVLANENIEKLRQDIQDTEYFCNGDYKFSFLVQGEMNAGKSTCLNALLGQRLLAVSSVPETNFITCVVYDREKEIPVLYKTTLSKIYNSQTSNFYIKDEDLELTDIQGTENIYNHLNNSNVESRKRIKDIDAQFKEKADKAEAEKEQLMKEMYKDVELNDTIYVIKCRITSLEEKIRDEFILNRIQLIDFPGMFEYGQKKITEIYKVFADHNQGLMNILDSLGYRSHVITKLQNFEKYPNRLLVVINKMDQIDLYKEEERVENRAMQLLNNLQNSLTQEANCNPSNDSHKTKYLQMSQEAPNTVHFVLGKEEMMLLYLSKYRNSTQEEEKKSYDSILKSLAEDDRDYSVDLRKSKKKDIPFAEMDCFEYFEERKNNLFEKIRESMADKFRCRFNELVFVDYPKKLNAIREELNNFVEKLMKEKSEEKNLADNVHILYQCDECGVEPIVGVRYHCKFCKSFDYCEKCQATKEHSQHEFQVIENFDFAEEIRKICFENMNFLVQEFMNYHADFLFQLRDLKSGLAECYKSKKSKECFEDLVKSHCIRYMSYKKEKSVSFKEKFSEGRVRLQVLFSQLEGYEIKTISNLFANSLEPMTVFFKKFKDCCNLLFASCANLLHHIIIITLKKPIPQLQKDLFEDIDLSAIVCTQMCEPDSLVNNLNDLSTQALMWSAKFDILYSTIADDLLEQSKITTEKVNSTIAFGETLKVIFKDNAKSNQLKNKLGQILQKINDINGVK